MFSESGTPLGPGFFIFFQYDDTGSGKTIYIRDDREEEAILLCMSLLVGDQGSAL